MVSVEGSGVFEDRSYCQKRDPRWAWTTVIIVNTLEIFLLDDASALRAAGGDDDDATTWHAPISALSCPLSISIYIHQHHRPLLKTTSFLTLRVRICLLVATPSDRILLFPRLTPDAVDYAHPCRSGLECKRHSANATLGERGLDVLRRMITHLRRHDSR